jgi:hypothetical protein
MSSGQLITEISRIKEMMGITESKRLLKESIGDEIAEILAKFLRKDVTELTALGVRNADDLKKLMDDFLDPAISAANKVDTLRLILDDLGEAAVKSIAKSAIDDVTTGVGKELSDKVNTYLGWYKQGIMTYDQVLTQVTDDLTLAMSKSSDELVSLKNAINDEALLKVKGQLDNAKSALDSEADAAARASKEQQMQLDMTTKLETQFQSIKSQIEGLPSFKSLTAEEQKAVREFLENNKSKNLQTLFDESNTYVLRILNDPARVKQIPLKDRKFLERMKIFLSNPKALLTYSASGAIIIVIALLLTGNIGAARSKYNENMEDWEANDPDNPKEDEEETSTTCDATLEKFKTYLDNLGVDSSDATWDTNTCTGTVSGISYSYKDGQFI